MKKRKNDGTKLTILFLIVMLILTFVCFFLPAVTDYTYIVDFFTDIQSIITMLITLFFWVVILAIVIHCKKVFHKRSNSVLSDLNRLNIVISTIDDNEEYDDYDLLDTVDLLKGNCQEAFLVERFDNYRKSLESLKVESSDIYSCDISDYINFDEICDHIKKVSAENLAASLTGIGILGTFIGLAFGLYFFDAGTVDSIQSSISPLINGIKTAFYTSIYGVLSSLLLNASIKNKLYDLDLELDSFYFTYYDKVVSFSDYSSQKKSLELQIEQRDLMANFAETIAISVSREMNSIMAPFFENLGSSLDAVSEKIAISQTEGLERIVDSFVNSMNESLGDNFNALGASIEKNCELQVKSTDILTNIIEKLNLQSENMSNMNQQLETTISMFDESIKKLADQQEGLATSIQLFKEANEASLLVIKDIKNVSSEINEKYEDIGNIIEATGKTLENSVKVADDMVNNIDTLGNEMKNMIHAVTESVKNEVSEYLSNVANSVDSSAIKLSTEFEKMQQFIEEKTVMFNNQIKQTIEEVTTTVKNEMSEYFNIASKSMEVSAEKLSSEYEKIQLDINHAMNRTFQQFDRQISDIVGYLATAVREVNSTTEKMPRIVNELFKVMKDETEEYIANISETNTRLIELKRSIESKE